MASEEQFPGENLAKLYSSYREETPVFLIEKIVSILKEKYDGPLDLATDVGCGTGQSTVTLAPFFKRVHGLDVSEPRIKEAKDKRALPNVTYEVGPAETLPFEDGRVQLVSAGSALHWFQMDAFFSEVRRVLCNNGVLAVYCYYIARPYLEDPAKMEEVYKLYDQFYALTSKYHAPQIRIAYSKYVNVDFPFEEVQRSGEVRNVFYGKLERHVTGFVGTCSKSCFQTLKRDDKEEAVNFVSYFRRRLKEIVTECNIDPEKDMKLFNDYYLIVCRKSVPDA